MADMVLGACEWVCVEWEEKLMVLCLEIFRTFSRILSHHRSPQKAIQKDTSKKDTIPEDFKK